ncbi:hypothetical protein F5141DRAFT_1106898 [Pisolithus sp. B1]|nr:hypothetical protein F5141DRAFT_1106898 [Pisolithus sp. B1]
MRFTSLTLFVAPFITAVVGVAINPNNDTCIPLGGTCDSLEVCCPGWVCHYGPTAVVGLCDVSFRLISSPQFAVMIWTFLNSYLLGPIEIQECA